MGTDQQSKREIGPHDISETLEWSLSGTRVVFRFKGTEPPRMPIGSASSGGLEHLGPSAPWNALEELWAEGLVSELGPGEWSCPAEAVLDFEPEQILQLNLSGPTNLKSMVRTQGIIGHEGLGVTLDLFHPTIGRLSDVATKIGPFRIIPGSPPVLLSKDLYLLATAVETGPAGTTAGEQIEFLAEVQKRARKAAADLEGFLQTEDYSIPEQVQIGIKEESPDRLELVPQLNPAESATIPEEILRRPQLPKVYSSRDHAGHRRRVVTSKVRDRVEEINRRTAVEGADIPRFIENPEAFLPQGIDLEDFSERVKGLRTVVYNSRPYLHVKRLEGGWFEGIPGVELEGIVDDARPDGSAADESGNGGASRPPDLSPETYRKLAEEARRTGEEYLRHGDDWVRIDAAQAKQYLDTLGELAEYDPSDTGQFRMPHSAILDIYENLEALEFDLPPAEQLSLQFSTEDLPTPDMSPSFDGTLNAYQQDGYRWLAYLDQKGTGGLLADDMGLGKTVQVIAHMTRLADEGRLRPSLVVCPKTLIPNWDSEIRRFFPSQTNIGVLQAGRAHADQLAAFDIVLLSYDILRHQQFEIAKVDWEFIVSDEAQFAKNPTAQRTTALKALKARHRAALTGTPVENGMIEFWCIMDFVRPGLLGSWGDFRAEYERPLVQANTEGERDPIVFQLLGHIGRHYLRRMKQDVLHDLPPKQDIPIETGFSADQLSLYRQVARQGRSRTPGAALSAIHKLLLLSAHPAALTEDGNDFIYVQGECPKLDVMIGQLRSIKSVGEKALVFTRFLKIQRILQSAIRQEFDVWPDVINGSITVNRQRIVDIFSASPGFNVLILSHDVGGVGLNITSANHVFHYTRPWNPAKENQATDRVHRIGQDKAVSVYYPVVKDPQFETVEERLGRLLDQKSSLARDVLRPSREAAVSGSELLSCVEEVPDTDEPVPGSSDQGNARPDLAELIRKGETTAVEFKSTLRINLHTGQQDPKMVLSCLKTIAGFLNSHGGTLIIGVADDGDAIGIETDGFPSEDKMNLHLVNLIRTRIGPQYGLYIDPVFEEYDGQRVLRVDCSPSKSAVFVKDDNIERFYIRTGASTAELTASQTQDFIRQRFS